MENQKLVLINVKEKNTKARSTQVIIYDEAHDILKNLSSRTGLSLAMIANKMIKFAADYIEIDGEED